MWYTFNLGIHNAFYRYKNHTIYGMPFCDMIPRFQEKNKGTMGEVGYTLTEVPKREIIK